MIILCGFISTPRVTCFTLHIHIWHFVDLKYWLVQLKGFTNKSTIIYYRDFYSSCIFMFILLYWGICKVVPSGVWVVWSVGGPWKPPLASTQSWPSSLGMLTQVHCPDSKSQLPGGLQAPSLIEISSNFTVELVPGTWLARNTTWWRTWTFFRKQPYRNDWKIQYAV